MAKASGKLNDADYKDVLIPQMEKLMAEHGQVRLLFHMEEGFQSWDPHAAWDGAKFGLAHGRQIERFGVVGGPKWVSWGVKIKGHLIKAEVKTFPPEQLEQALAWIKG